MIDRKHIEAILRTNGIQPTANDDEIKSVLLKAKYNADEVDAAVMVLKEDKDTKDTKVYGLHKVFRTDQTLTPEEITSLLGIDVKVDELKTPRSKKTSSTNYLSSLVILTLSVLLAVAVVCVYMYVEQIGIFHIYTTNAG